MIMNGDLDVDMKPSGDMDEGWSERRRCVTAAVGCYQLPTWHDTNGVAGCGIREGGQAPDGGRMVMDGWMDAEVLLINAGFCKRLNPF